MRAATSSLASRLTPGLGDLAIAVVVAAVAVVELWLPLPSAVGTGSRPLATALILLSCAALTQRRRHPLAAAFVVLVPWPVLHTLLPMPVLFWGQFVPIVIALYSVARYGSDREGLIGAGAGAATLLYIDLRVDELSEPSEIVFHWMVCSVAWGLGFYVRGHERRAQEAAARAVRAETFSRDQALRAVVDERARIARELHDIVAHSVSVMVVQAGAAEKALDDPEFVRRALGAIRTTGTGALTEMRRVVSLIRDDSVPDGLEPQPALADLERLVGEMEVPTTLQVEGEERAVSAGVALSAYRIVQEALTNVRRHARAEAVHICVRYGEDALEIEVRDDGVGATGTAGGHGLIGMSERAQVFGGTVDTLTAPGEGFRVRATIPLEPSP